MGKKSKYVGVRPVTYIHHLTGERVDAGTWQAYFRGQYLGSFKTELLAHEAYVDAKQKYQKTQGKFTKPPITEEEFDRMKLLQSQGHTTTDTAKWFDRASSTMSYVYRAETYKDYRDMASRKYGEGKTRKTVTASVNLDLDKVNEKLDRILEDLGRLEEQIKLIPKRRKF